MLAACSTCTPLPMPSSRLLMSLARLLSDWAVKKLVGLSRAELTLLPVARRFCVVASRSAVDCSESRFWRTDAERTIPDIFIPFWCETFSVRCADPSIGRGATVRRKTLKKHEADRYNRASQDDAHRRRRLLRGSRRPPNAVDITAFRTIPPGWQAARRLPSVNHSRKGLRQDRPNCARRRNHPSVDATANATNCSSDRRLL